MHIGPDARLPAGERGSLYARHATLTELFAYHRDPAKTARAFLDPHTHTLGDVGFVHGHAWPAKPVMEANVLLMGHNHPAVVFVDRLGGRHVEPCWMRVPFRRKHKRYARLPKEAVCVPSFNELCGGTPVNDAAADLLGPLTKPDVVNLDRARLHLLDGTDLGLLPSLRVDAHFRWSDYRQ